MNLQAINLLPEEEEKKKIVPNNQEPLTFSEEQKQIDTALAEEEPTSFNSDLSNNTVTPPENSAPPADAAETNEPDRPVFKTAEEYQKFFGITPEETERPVYDSKERQEALSKRNNLSALGEAFKLIVEADGASNGMYVDKREPNKYMTANEAKIQELKDKDLLEERRRADNKVLDAFRRAGMWSQYTSDLNRMAHQEDMQEDAQAYRTSEREAGQEDAKELIDLKAEKDPMNNKEFLEWKANLEVQKQKEISQARTEDDIRSINAKYDKMLEYQESMVEEGIKDGADDTNGKYKIGEGYYSKEDIDLIVADAYNKGELPKEVMEQLQLGMKLDQTTKLAIAQKILGLRSEGMKAPNNADNPTPEWIKESEPGMFMNMPIEEETKKEEDFYGRTLNK